jgi:hypothetical protein
VQTSSPLAVASTATSPSRWDKKTGSFKIMFMIKILKDTIFSVWKKKYRWQNFFLNYLLKQYWISSLRYKNREIKKTWKNACKSELIQKKIILIKKIIRRKRRKHTL